MLCLDSRLSGLAALEKPSNITKSKEYHVLLGRQHYFVFVNGPKGGSSIIED